MPTIPCKQCGTPFEATNGRSRYCSAACFKASEAAYSTRVRKTWSKVRRRAHDLVNSAIHKGKLTRRPCEVCGDSITVAHHDDYAKPLDVRWLCRKHHAQHHLAHGPGANSKAEAA